MSGYDDYVSGRLDARLRRKPEYLMTQDEKYEARIAALEQRVRELERAKEYIDGEATLGIVSVLLTRRQP